MRHLTLLLLLVSLTSCQLPSNRAARHVEPAPVVEGTPLRASSPFQPAIRRVARTNAQEVALIESGQDALLARLHLIDNARERIDLQTFIWADDECGALLTERLIAAAMRGVKVRVLIDYIGIAKDAKALAFAARAHPNLHVRIYRPTARTLERGVFGTLTYALTDFKGANQRMHHKVLTIDNAIGITGGRNVENSYFDHARIMNFRDRDVLVIGKAAATMAETFDAFWQYRHTMPALSLTDVAKATATIDPNYMGTAIGQRLRQLSQQANVRASVRRTIRGLEPVDSVQYISDLPGKNGAYTLDGGGASTVHVMRALEEAKEELWIQSPYLVLGRKGRRFFRKYHKERPAVRVHISTNSFGSTDNYLAYAGNVRNRDRYVLQYGFHVSEFRPWPSHLRQMLPTYDWLHQQSQQAKERPTFLCLHAKSFTVDDHLAFVGSFNLDPRSAHLNTECGLIIRDRGITAALKRVIQRDHDARNSWIIAARAMPTEIHDASLMTRDLTDLSPIDVNLLDSSSAYELRSGQKAVPRDHPEFYQRFRDIGSLPGTSDPLSEEALKMRLLRFSTPLLDPLL